MNFTFGLYFSTTTNNIAILYTHNLCSTDNNDLQDYKFKHDYIKSISNLYRGIKTGTLWTQKTINGKQYFFLNAGIFCICTERIWQVNSLLFPKIWHSNPPCSMEAIEVAMQSTNLLWCLAVLLFWRYWSKNLEKHFPRGLNGDIHTGECQWPVLIALC